MNTTNAKGTNIIQRIFSLRGFKRAFSIARLVAAILGAAVMAVYFLIGVNSLVGVMAAIGMAFTSYILFRYGQIKSYLP